MSELRFDGCTVIVTGAGRGLGRAYAELLSKRGASLVVNDIDADVAAVTAAALPGAVAASADVSMSDGAASVVDAALTAFGRVDAVVANAGTSSHVMFDDMDGDDLEAALSTNLWSTFHIVRAVWPHLAESGRGRVVTTASGAVFGFVGRAHYAAAKGGVLALTNTLAIEGAAHGIHVNCVLPQGHTRLARPGSNAPDASLAAPPLVWLCHETCIENGSAFSIGGGRIARVRLTQGTWVDVDGTTPEAYRDALTL
ncbi:MAG TPA: SDR family NAD(P)-dependent oxidoreductase [Ilumatobacteraceae bacterium]|nr:SDR family NAD(P)-dependent oxidoreductase [Ilumatobacteraceae bacterium]